MRSEWNTIPTQPALTGLDIIMSDGQVQRFTVEQLKGFAKLGFVLKLVKLEESGLAKP